MDDRTLQTAHNRIDQLEKDMVALQTEVRIQFKELFVRVKRIETTMMAASGAIMLMLVTILVKMG
jgi:hypothetical protein|tara:strand:+ start:163 stop:357 length:195 start_codon:yes stop_codon:yes gene_type:complete